MNRCLIILVCLLVLLSGCSGADTLEVMYDSYESALVAAPAMVHLDFSEDHTFTVTQGEGWYTYTGENYEIIMQTCMSGDLNQTFQQITGYAMERLTVMEIPSTDADRYVCAWSTVSEEGELVGRCTVIDDGVYHYCLSVLVDAKTAGEYREDIDAIFATYSLESY